MNWTGGALGRTRNCNGTLAIQKKHFANARAKLDAKRPISYEFQAWTQQPMKSPRSSGDRYLSPSRCSSQRTLDEFKETRPIIKKLKSIRPKRAEHEASSSGLRNDNLYNRTPTQINRQASPITISSRSSSLTSSDDEDTPAAKTPNTQSAPHRASDPYDIEAQRRRLLETDDWVGIHRNRPAKIKFQTAEDRDQIGKRRKLSPTHAQPSIWRRKHLRDTSFFEGLGRSPHLSQDYVSQGDVSIRIGSAVDRSTKEVAPVRASSMQNSWSEEDEMLLDEGAIQVRDRYPNPFLKGETVFEGLSRPASAELNMPSPDSMVLRTSDPFYEEEKDDPSKNGVHDEQDLPFDVAARAMRLKEDIEQYQMNDELGFHVAVDQVLSVHESGQAKVNSRSTLGRDLASVIDIEDACHDRRKHASGSSLASSSIQSENLAGLHAKAFKQDISGVEEARVSAMRSNSNALGKEVVKPVDTLYNHDANDLGLHHGNRKLQAGKLASDKSKLRDELEAMEKGNITMNDNKSPSVIPGILVTPSSPLSADTNGPQPMPRKVSPLQKERLSVPSQKPNNSATAPLQEPMQPISQPIEDEEAIWRSFVFSDDDPTKSEWTFDEVEGADPNPETVSSSPNHPSHTQPSMIAEVATSPIKQNPHLVEENRLLDSATSPPSAKTDARSMLAEASSTSFESAFFGEEEEVSLPDLPPAQFSPETLSSTSPLTNATTSSCNPLAQTILRDLPTPFSTEAQAATTTPSTPSSSTDPLTHFSTPPPASRRPSQHRKDSLPLQARRQAAVLFMKPARYVGSMSSDPIEPIVLGGRRRRSARLREKVRATNDGGGVAGANGLGARMVALEGEETTGLGWERGVEGDEIEDVE